MTVIHEATALESLGESTLVPTMGALHEGHLSLIRMAARSERPVVVSIFVNPTQFAPHEDFSTYPRTLERDIESSMANGADVIYAPDIQDIYPRGLEAATVDAAKIPLPEVARTPGLEDGQVEGKSGYCQFIFHRSLKPEVGMYPLVRCFPGFMIFGKQKWCQSATSLRSLIRAINIKLSITGPQKKAEIKG